MNQYLSLVAFVTLLLLSGCTSQKVTHVNCSTIACLQEVTHQLAANECVQALSQPIITKAHQAQLDAVYAYPLKNTANYATFVGSGGRGPSPKKWCDAWAKVKTGQTNLAKR